MAQASHTAFPHRQNADGSFDSICSECFRTVATASTEAQLQAVERVHHYRCKGFKLEPFNERFKGAGVAPWPKPHTQPSRIGKTPMGLSTQFVPNVSGRLLLRPPKPSFRPWREFTTTAARALS